MRNVLAVAALALPMFASAQAMHTGISHLVASVDAPAFAFQASAVNAVSPRVFTGLIAPIRLSALTLAPARTENVLPGTVNVEFTVSAAGVPENVHVTSAVSKETDYRVAEAVRNMRYTPGKLNGQAIAVPMILHVNVQ